jgi:molybdate transport system regulatory protein
MKPKLKVWVTFGDDMKFGDGRARLLELIEEHGSLRRAAKEFEMSYRHAWGYLRELERAAGFPFVVRGPGGGPQSGMRLTAAGKRFIQRYRKFREGLVQALRWLLTRGRYHAMTESHELTLEELRARIHAAGLTIPDNRLGMVRKLLSDALVHVRALDSRTVKTVEPAVRFTPDGGGR